MNAKEYTITKAVSYGVANYEVFDEHFTHHFRLPSFICTDAKYDCIRYCQKKGFNHYVKPSNYMKILEENGYLNENQI